VAPPPPTPPHFEANASLLTVSGQAASTIWDSLSSSVCGGCDQGVGGVHDPARAEQQRKSQSLTLRGSTEGQGANVKARMRKQSSMPPIDTPLSQRGPRMVRSCVACVSPELTVQAEQGQEQGLQGRPGQPMQQVSPQLRLPEIPAQLPPTPPPLHMAPHDGRAATSLYGTASDTTTAPSPHLWLHPSFPPHHSPATADPYSQLTSTGSASLQHSPLPRSSIYTHPQLRASPIHLKKGSTNPRGRSRYHSVCVCVCV